MWGYISTCMSCLCVRTCVYASVCVCFVNLKVTWFCLYIKFQWIICHELLYLSFVFNRSQPFLLSHYRTRNLYPWSYILWWIQFIKYIYIRKCRTPLLHVMFVLNFVTNQFKRGKSCNGSIRIPISMIRSKKHVKDKIQY